MKKIVLAMLFAAFVSAASLPSAVQQKGTAAGMKPALPVIDIQNAFLPNMSGQDKKPGMEMNTSRIDPTLKIFLENAR